MNTETETVKSNPGVPTQTLFLIGVAISLIVCVAVVQGIHSFYALLAGLLLTILFPRIIKEDITKRKLAQKFAGAIVIFIGIAIVNLV